jgi:hypothetical protein
MEVAVENSRESNRTFSYARYWVEAHSSYPARVLNSSVGCGGAAATLAVARRCGDERHRRAPPGNLSACSIQLGTDRRTKLAAAEPALLCAETLSRGRRHISLRHLDERLRQIDQSQNAPMFRPCAGSLAFRSPLRAELGPHRGEASS